MAQVIFVDVIVKWLNVNADKFGSDPIQVQRALASVNQLIAYLDETWRDEPRDRRTQARRLLAEAVGCRKALERLVKNGAFTKDTRTGNLSTNARNKYRDLLKRVLEWCRASCPQSADYFKAAVMTG